MEIIKIVLNIIQGILLVYFFISTIYLFVFALAGIFPRRKKPVLDNKERKFAVLIPGYKEDEVIYEVCEDALKQNYPKELYKVVAICDSYQPETIAKLKQLPIEVIEVSFDVSTKSKALNKAMDILGDSYEVALVLDADNLIAPDFLQKMNQAFQKGYLAVQGHRIAKNVNTNFAILDAISEEINNNIFRKGTRNLGFSSAIIGSGMAFEYSFFKKMMKDVHAVGGFDKEIDLKMCRDGIKIEYVENAFCLDEKVQKPEVFQNQRRRWMSAQIIYFKRFFFLSIIHLFTKGNFDFFNKAFHTFLPPRILLLGFVGIAFFIALFFYPSYYAMLWISLFLLLFLTFIIAFPRDFYTKKTLVALSSLPYGFFLMFLSLIKVRGANKKFLHTKHTSLKNNN